MTFSVQNVHRIFEPHAVDTTCTASYTPTFFDMWLICLYFHTGLLHSAIAYNHSLQKFAAVPGSQVSVVPLQLAAQEMWDSVVAEPANSLLNFRLYSQENDRQAGVSAQWHAQENTIQTYSDAVMLCVQLSACIVLLHIGCNRPDTV